jgi:hypothetical protein
MTQTIIPQPKTVDLIKNVWKCRDDLKNAQHKLDAAIDALVKAHDGNLVLGESA